MENVEDKAAKTKEIPKRNFPVVPTTKILAIGPIHEASNAGANKGDLSEGSTGYASTVSGWEDRPMVVRQTQTGPVFLLNVTSLEEARALMEELPLGQAGLMKHEFIELGPLTPLHMLLTDGGSTASE